MVKSNPDTVLLHGDDDSGEIKEGEANGTITPGDVLELDGIQTSRGEDERQYVRNATDGDQERRVALEFSHTGRGIGDDYSSGDGMLLKTLESGDEAYMFVFDGSNAGGSAPDVSSNANISVGDKLVPYSGGGQDGTLRQYDSANDDEGAVLGEAVEAVDNSSSSSPARIRVEVF